MNHDDGGVNTSICTDQLSSEDSEFGSNKRWGNNISPVYGGAFEISNLSPIFDSTSTIPQNNSTSLLRVRTDASLGCQLGKDKQPVQEGTCLIGTMQVYRFILKTKDLTISGTLPYSI
ncbi:unnamed protein product [Fusarium venenatum]|uniref:Uncharacterized protein n=1 Tax=Fusarium venenatum TaxID=56646 RepID=A0A2L2THM4_9HYPO|nr:uncharacterized protein FVRRES_01413 [Fusarium venenatum]CEI64901.1 unnamed protein product [Fusarium venenatum]